MEVQKYEIQIPKPKGKFQYHNLYKNDFFYCESLGGFLFNMVLLKSFDFPLGIDNETQSLWVGSYSGVFNILKNLFRSFIYWMEIQLMQSCFKLIVNFMYFQQIFSFFYQNIYFLVNFTFIRVLLISFVYKVLGFDFL